MKRVGHGDTNISADASALVGVEGLSANDVFGSMFPGLADDPANRLPEGPDVVAQLKALGAAMVDPNEPSPVDGPGEGDSEIPAIYTYFGQFTDHDITFDTNGLDIAGLSSPDLAPRGDLEGLINSRTVHLDLDCVYAGDAPRDGDRMRIGTVSESGDRPAGKSDFNDLPRQPPSDDASIDRAAMIGDPRNDENLIVSQLHLAFLKAHNALVADGRDFREAQKALRQRFQLIVLDDFLPRICDASVIDDIRTNGPRWDLGGAEEIFMPVEFAVAAYRFGHSMIRTNYDHNVNFSPTGLDLLFTFTALSGEMFGLPTLPENWIIEWERFVEIDGSSPQRARKLNTQLSDFTFKLQNTFGNLEGADSDNPDVQQIAPMLATRNLLRGYHLGLATGQAVARELGLEPLEGQALLDALPTDELRSAAEPFADRTPLWFYVLAEAGDPNGPNGEHLGPVGSRILGDAFWHFIKESDDSVLDEDGSCDVETFTLPELIALAFRDEQGAAAGSSGSGAEPEPAGQPEPGFSEPG